jgi:hypothetical protein
MPYAADWTERTGATIQLLDHMGATLETITTD